MKNFLLLIIVLTLTNCNLSKKDIHSPTSTESKILLHDIWAIKKINGEPITTQTQKHIQIEFNSTTHKFYGNDSCNEIFGDILHLNNTDIQLGNVASTKMMCLEMQVAATYKSLLRKVRHYKIKDLHLYLLDSNKIELLSFNKVD